MLKTFSRTTSSFDLDKGSTVPILWCMAILINITNISEDRTRFGKSKHELDDVEDVIAIIQMKMGVDVQHVLDDAEELEIDFERAVIRSFSGWVMCATQNHVKGMECVWIRGWACGETIVVPTSVQKSCALDNFLQIENIVEIISQWPTAGKMTSVKLLKLRALELYKTIFSKCTDHYLCPVLQKCLQAKFAPWLKSINGIFQNGWLSHPYQINNLQRQKLTMTTLLVTVIYLTTEAAALLNH